MESVEIQWENNNIYTIFDEGSLFEGGFRQEVIIFSTLECENRVPGMIHMKSYAIGCGSSAIPLL